MKGNKKKGFNDLNKNIAIIVNDENEGAKYVLRKQKKRD